MRYLLPGLIILPLLLAGCTEANYIKLTHQAKACMGDNTVRCTDIRIRQTIADTKLKRKKLTDEEEQALVNIGKTNYERLLAVFDQKIAHLQDQRPNVLRRWFSGDTEDYDEIDLGWRYDAQMEQLVREIDAALQYPGQSQPAKQSVTTSAETTSPAANPLLANQQQEQTSAIATQTLPHYSGSPQTDNAFNQFIKQHSGQVVTLDINIQGDYERELITYGYRGVSPTFSTVQNSNFDYAVFINCDEVNTEAEDSIGKCSPVVQWDQNTGKLSGTFRIDAKGRNDMQQSLVELVAVPAA